MNCELELGLDSQELKKISLSLSDKMLHAKETTKMINQVASANSQPSFQPQPALQASNKQNSTVVSLLITAHRNHLNITNQTSTRNKCTKGGQRNQWSRNFANGARYCSYCDSETHNTDRCGFGPAVPKCFKCKQNGHLARDCPEPQGNAYQNYGPHVQNNGGQLNPFNQGN